MERPELLNRAKMPPSRLGGVPAIVPPPAEHCCSQLALPIAEGKAPDREPLPGAVHVRGWLPFRRTPR
jgi:hypothetical protein